MATYSKTLYVLRIAMNNPGMGKNPEKSHR